MAARIHEDFGPTPEQATAIAAPLRPRVVVAGAGSGKTQTMGLRVVWLVANGLIEPHRILGLTFTRKAAAELGERIRRMLRALRSEHERSPFLTDEVALALQSGEPTVSTYHSYASALVGEHALRIGLEPSVRLISEALAWQYSAQVVETYAGSMDAVERVASSVTGDVLALAGELAEHLREPAEVRALTALARSHLAALPRAAGQRAGNVPPPLAELIASLDARLDVLPMVERYHALKRERGAMDFGDQVAVAARIARLHPEVGEIERSRFGAVLLDEYQDTGEAQRVLLTSLFAGHPVTAVGDPRQSIYGWRGASSGNLERFLADFSGDGAGRRRAVTNSTGLSVSFRNGEAILAVANQVAAGIPVRGLDDRPLTPGPGRESCRSRGLRPARHRRRRGRLGGRRCGGAGPPRAASGAVERDSGARAQAFALPPSRGRAAGSRCAVRGRRPRRSAARAGGGRHREHAASRRRPDRGQRRRTPARRPALAARAARPRRARPTRP